ncbi:hypothetical protein Tco_0206685 [Tanacetum coccineum]
MASQDARLSKFEADFKQQQGEMTNKIDTVLKAIDNQITGALPSDTVKSPKLNVNPTSLVLYARSYPIQDPQCSSHIHDSINVITMCSKQINNLIMTNLKLKRKRLMKMGHLYAKELKARQNFSPQSTNLNHLWENKIRTQLLPNALISSIQSPFLSKDDKHGEKGIVKPGTKDDHPDTIVKQMRNVRSQKKKERKRRAT